MDEEEKVMEEEQVEEEQLSNIDEVMKKSTLTNPDLTFCEKTTYLDFLLSNAKDEEEEKQIKQVVDGFLEIAKEDNDEE